MAQASGIPTIDAGQDGIGLGPGFTLWQVTNAWQRAVRAALLPLGLTYVQLALLIGLRDRLDQGLRVNQAGLAERLGTDAMMTSQVLRVLETMNYVERTRSSDDTRVRLLDLTVLGRRQIEQAIPVLREVEREFFSPLGRKEEKFYKRLHMLVPRNRNEAGKNVNGMDPSQIG